jgi:molybdopterin synthase catalytic subunit
MIVTHPIDIAALLSEAHRPGAGGIVLFSGEVRNTQKNRDVQFLEYEAYAPLAEEMIEAIVEDAKQRWKLQYANAVHRIGRLEISESAVVVITAHAHRKAAYEANQFIIDAIKRDVPIWKCEHFVDGTHEWGTNLEAAKTMRHAVPLTRTTRE